MKKSEMARFLRDLQWGRLDSAVATAIHQMEAAGVVWEEEPLAVDVKVADLYGIPGFQGVQYALAVVRDGVRERLLTKAEARLAADLYNRRGAIDSVARDIRRWTGGDPASSVHLLPGELRRWADALEGK